MRIFLPKIQQDGMMEDTGIGTYRELKRTSDKEKWKEISIILIII